MVNKNRILLLTVFFILTMNEARSQFAVAGINGAIYVDIVPDTFLNPHACLCIAEEYYNIDINQDGINDIKIHAYTAISAGNTTQLVNVLALDTNTSLSFWKTDSVYFDSTCMGPYWYRVNILTPYNFGDSVKNGVYVANAYLGFFTRYACGPTVSCQEWIDNTDHYIGVKYSDTSGVYYGWITVNVSDYYKVWVKDFTLWKPVVGIEEVLNIPLINIYPNPTASYFTVHGLKKGRVDVFNAFGGKVYSENLSSEPIDLNQLPGIYFVRVSDGEKVYMQKLVIE